MINGLYLCINYIEKEIKIKYIFIFNKKIIKFYLNKVVNIEKFLEYKFRLKKLFYLKYKLCF